jgi:uncharacterized 2Fe-2S/4Fe-4S cluster protein (DUF4445 family)
MYKIIFKPSDLEIESDGNKSLLQLAHELNLKINSACGGMGQCGKCLIKTDKKGEVLACQTFPSEDMIIELSDFNEANSKGKFAFVNFIPKPEEISAVSSKIYLEIAKPTLEDNSDDLSRLQRFLLKNGISNAHINLNVLRKLAKTLRDADWKITVAFSHYPRDEIIEIESGKVDQNYGLAIDIGTTTVAAALIDLKNGKVVDFENDYNGQISLGEDVLSRINYAKNGGLDELNKRIIETINELINRILERKHCNREDITSAVISGNTTMEHLFLKLNPEYIRIEPYIPVANHAPSIRAADLGINISSCAKVYCVPGASSYVGGDVISDIIASDMHKKEHLCLLIDLGTNGEIVLGNRDWMLSCSCSAGPAFEGIGIEKGMAAKQGAIEDISISGSNTNFKLVSGTEPLGICGSGLIDLMAELHREKVLDRAGDFPMQDSRINGDESGKKFHITENIWITESEIKNLIRTKAAVFAGCKTLLESVDKSFQDVNEIIVAGGLGNYLNIDNAIKIGLLPDVARDKFKFIGNGSLAGAHAMIISKTKRDEAIEVSKKMSYLELSTENKFMDEFTSALFIPHTNIDLFPSAK